MWLDSILLFLAEEFGLKASGDRIFGVVNGQYICMYRNQQGYHLVARVNVESRAVIEGISKDHGIPKSIGLKRNRVEFGEDHFVMSGIVGHLFPSKAKIKIKGIILSLTDMLSKHQKFSNPTTAETILLNGVPAPRDEKIIQQAEEERAKKSLKPIDHQRGMVWGVIFGVGLGILLGGLRWLMIRYAKSDLNFFAKGFISCGLSVFLYTKLAGGVDKKSRFSVAILSLVIFLVWDMSWLYFQYQSSNVTLELSRLLEIYQSHFTNFSVFGKFAIAAIVVILGFSFFLVKPTILEKNTVEEGEFLKLESLKKVNKEEKKLWILIPAGFVVVASAGFLSLGGLDDFEYVRLDKFFIIGSVVQVLTMIGCHFLWRKLETFQLLLNMNKGHKGVVPYILILGVFSFFVSLTTCFLASGINIYFDKSEIVKSEAQAYEDYQDGKHECSWLSVESSTLGIFKHRACKPRATLITKGELVELETKQGYLNIPYVLKFKLPHLESLESYLGSGRKVESLRLLYMTSFYEMDKSEGFKKHVKDWKKSCLKTPDMKCRLRSYVYDIEKDYKKALEFLQKACFVNDPVSCRGILLNQVSTDEDKGKAKAHLREKCVKGDHSYCMELVWSLWNMSFENNRSEIVEILDKSCRKGFSEACETQKGVF